MKKKETRIETVETTIGELIEAITQIACEGGRSEEEGYKLASLTLENILNRNAHTQKEVLDLLN
jgi:hypothetical protein